jgi:hypothetical protein
MHEWEGANVGWQYVAREDHSLCRLFEGYSSWQNEWESHGSDDEMKVKH